MTTSSHIVRPGLGPKHFATECSTATPARHRSAGKSAGFWKTLWDQLIPFGYEDETGFHYGTPQKPKSTKNW